LKYSEEDISSFLASAEAVLRKGFLSEGSMCREWERGFAEFQNAPAAIAVTSCTTGLEAILKAIDVRGKKVLIPTNTFFATATAVECAGGIPVLLDSDIRSFALCKEDLSRKINKDVGAVIIVHVGGIIPSNILEIKALCDSYGVPLVEDAAHAHGSYLTNETAAGSIGIAGSFSFFPTKVMTTGEGGMVTASPDFIQRVKLIKNFGADPDNEKTCLIEQGSNYRVHEFTALLGILENRRAKHRIARRQLLARRYIENLRGTAYEPVTQDEGSCSFYKLILMTDQVGKAADITSFCKQRNITLTGRVYETPIHRQPRFVARYPTGSFPIADRISECHICPPLYPELAEDEVDYICEMLLEYSLK